ncbi:MAG: 2-C-methyl-D-erythritol 2,4-cyclodiphosphate synthase [Clostridia bacterium]|nr:2-C-methyl-D-erythritol 2,4-cyclodiphosphate synthase [Clostridia bacterium]
MYDVIIAAGGLSLRVGFDKLTEKIGEKTVLQRTVNAFYGRKGVEKIIVVGKEIDIPGVVCVPGGKTRHESVRIGLEYADAPYVLIHDGARPFLSLDLIDRIERAAEKYGSAIPVLPIYDSLRTVEDGVIIGSVDRGTTYAVQTPQGFRTAELRRAFSLASPDANYTDESELFSRYISPCHVVPGEERNKKITVERDFFGTTAKVGTGFDLHRYTLDKPLRLCGLTIPYEYGLLAHSDGDAPLHALMDALLTAAGERDIGVLFPDTDEKYKDADSTELLKTVLKILREKNLVVLSVNLTIIAQSPRLAPYLEEMRNNLAALLSVAPERVSLSATTTEKLGLIGENKALCALATVLVA